MKTTTNAWSRADCLHTAGIALARWYFGFPADEIEIKTPDDVSRPSGSRCRRSCETIVRGPPIAPVDLPDKSTFLGADHEWRRRCALVLAETELIVLACGFHAPAPRHRPFSLCSWKKDWPSDYARATTLAIWIADDLTPALHYAHNPEFHLDVAGVRGRALLDARQSKEALHWLAQDLRKAGRLDLDQIHENCTGDLCGLGPARATWSQSWPPGFDQLGAGHIPFLDVFEEDLIDRSYVAYSASKD